MPDYEIKLSKYANRQNTQKQQKRIPSQNQNAHGKAAGANVLAGVVALGVGVGVGAALYAIGSVSQPLAGTPDKPVLTQMRISELDNAANSLLPERKDELLRKAKACEEPLFFISLVKLNPSGNGAVRIRSGSYTSPLFVVGDTPQLIAVPAPVDYKIGAGTMDLLGTAQNVRFEFSPSVDLPILGGEHKQSVWWPTADACLE